MDTTEQLAAFSFYALHLGNNCTYCKTRGLPKLLAHLNHGLKRCLLHFPVKTSDPFFFQSATFLIADLLVF